MFYNESLFAHNSPVSNSPRPLNKSTHNVFVQVKLRPKVKYSRIPARRFPVYSSVYCLISKFVAPSRRYLSIFFQVELTLYKCVVIDLPQVVFLCSSCYEKNNERRSQRNERRSREETTCLACMDSNLICILLAGNYCYDVMDAS